MSIRKIEEKNRLHRSITRNSFHNPYALHEPTQQPFKRTTRAPDPLKRKKAPVTTECRPKGVREPLLSRWCSAGAHCKARGAWRSRRDNGPWRALEASSPRLAVRRERETLSRTAGGFFLDPLGSRGPLMCRRSFSLTLSVERGRDEELTMEVVWGRRRKFVLPETTRKMLLVGGACGYPMWKLKNEPWYIEKGLVVRWICECKYIYVLKLTKKQHRSRPKLGVIPYIEEKFLQSRSVVVRTKKHFF